jgi:hypothetical protein
MGLMDRFPWSKGEIMLATSKEWERQGNEILSLVSVRVREGYPFKERFLFEGIINYKSFNSRKGIIKTLKTLTRKAIIKKNKEVKRKH